MKPNLFCSPIRLFLVSLLLSFPLFADSPDHQPPPDPDPDPDPCEDPCGCEGQGGDPVSFYNGEFTLKKTFLSQPGALIPLALELNYSTFTRFNGTLGYGWTHNFNLRLYETDQARLAVRKASGDLAQYELIAGETMKYRSLDTEDEVITVNVDGSYTLTLRSQMTYVFDSEGKLTEIMDPRAGKLVLTYDPAGGLLPVTAVPRYTNLSVPSVVVRDYRLLRVEEELADELTGRFLEFFYDATGHINQVVDQTGRSVLLTYNASGIGELTRITDPEGLEYTFSYYSDASDRTSSYYRLMKTFVGLGCSDCVVRTNTYFNGGAYSNWVSSQIQGASGEGETININYTSNYTDVTYSIKDTSTGNVINTRQERFYLITDAFGDRKVSQRIIQRGGDFAAPENAVTGYTYDVATGRVTQENLPNGSQIAYVYDANGNIIQETHTVSDTVDLVIDRTYDGNNNLTLETRTQSDRPGESFTTEFEYDSQNRMIAEKRKRADGTYATTSMTYFTSGVHEGLMQSRTDARGNAMQFEYTTTADSPAPVGLLKREFDPANTSYQTTYTYDALGNRTSVTDALGHTSAFEYDNKRRLTKETNPIGFEKVYIYSGANLVEERMGNLVEGYRIRRFVYDGLNRREQIIRVNDVDEEAVQFSYTYDSEGQMLTETNALGQVMTYEYELTGWPTRFSQPFSVTETSDISFEYDPGGRAVKEIDPLGVESTASYDGLDRMIRKTEAVGTALQRSTTYAYDALGNVVQVTYSGEYDAQADTYGHVLATRYYYDSLGRLVGINWDPGNPAPDVDGARELPVLMTYDDSDNMISRTDGAGNTTIYTYDAYNRLVGINWDFVSDTPLANYEGELPEKRTFDAVGNLITQTDGAGNTVYFHYDASDRLTEQSVPRAPGNSLTGNWWETPTNVLQSVSYNVFDEILSVTNLAGGVATNVYNRFGLLTQSTNPDGLTLSYTYDGLDQVVSTIYPPVNPGGSATSVVNTYNAINSNLLDSLTDRAGNVTTYTYTKRFEQNTVLNSMGASTAYTFDALGRLVSEENASAEVTNYTYDQFDQLTTTTYPDHVPVANERIQTLDYDDYGLLISQTGAATYPATYTYDLARNLVAITTQYGASSANATTTWEYTTRNQLERKLYADAAAYAYSYDDAGNLAQRTDAKGQITQYRYNEYNLPTQIDYATDTDVAFVYDAFGRRISMQEGGTIDGSNVYQGGSTTQEWAYTTGNRVLEHKQHDNSYQLSYTYHVEGGRLQRVLERIDGSGSPVTIDYSYDGFGRLVTIADSNVSSTESFAYTYKSDANLIEQWTNPGGSKTTKTYDILGRLLQVLGVDSAATVASQHAYTYSAVGLRQDETLLDATKRQFTYDAKWQLVGAEKEVSDPAYDFAYQYDSIGNRLRYATDGNLTDTESTDTTYTSNNLNQYASFTLPSALPTTPAYDANGSLTSIDGVTYTWDEENRLVQVTDGAKTSQYFYDGLGRRVKKEEYTGATLDETIHYVYDENLVCAEVDANGNKLISYTRGLDLVQTLEGAGGVGSLLAMTIHDGNIGTVGSYYYFQDGSGNIVKLLDASDSEVASYTYDPFGRKLSSTGSLADTNPYQFSSKEYETNWNLNYYLFRFYNSDLGRWLNRDPYGEKGHDLLVRYYEDIQYKAEVRAEINALNAELISRTNKLKKKKIISFEEYSEAELEIRDIARKLNYLNFLIESASDMQYVAELLPEGSNLYAHVNNNSLLYVDPTGEFGIAGALIGGGIDLGLQLLQNGGNLSCVNWGQVAGSAALGAVGAGVGAKLAGVAGKGKVFSHWVPSRAKNWPGLGGKFGKKFLKTGNKYNGNYVSKSRHYKHDPYAYGNVKGEWKNWGSKWPKPVQQLDRIPNVYKGSVAGGVAGNVGGNIANSDCECP